jgi:hypothetical protein
LPPFESLLRALGIERRGYERAKKISLPKEVFRFLVKLSLESSEFNESGYMRENPDVANALRRGEVKDVREHYINFGYFEGRVGGTPTVDENWYLTAYPDVAVAVKLGDVGSAREHYNIIGSAEGRGPNANYVPVAEKWKKVLQKA